MSITPTETGDSESLVTAVKRKYCCIDIRWSILCYIFFWSVFCSIGISLISIIGGTVAIVEGSEDVGENAAILLNLQINPFFHKSFKLSKTLTRSVALDVYTANCDDVNAKTASFNHTLTSLRNSYSNYVMTTPNPLTGKDSSYQLQGSEVTFTIVPAGGSGGGKGTLYVFTDIVAFRMFVNDNINATNPQYIDSYSLQLNSTSPSTIEYSVMETGMYYFVVHSPHTDISSIIYAISGTYIYYDQTEYRHRCSMDISTLSCTVRIAPSRLVTESKDSVCVLVCVTPANFETDHSLVTVDYEQGDSNFNIGHVIVLIIEGVGLLLIFCVILVAFVILRLKFRSLFR